MTPTEDSSLDESLQLTATLRAKLELANHSSGELREHYEAMARTLDTGSADEIPEPDHKARLELAHLGTELAEKEQDVIRLERDSVFDEEDRGICGSQVAKSKLRQLDKRYFAAGEGRWEHQKRIVRFDPEASRLFDPRVNAEVEPILALYRRIQDPGPKMNVVRKKRSTIRDRRKDVWRNEVIEYYSGSKPQYLPYGAGIRGGIWCHILGRTTPEYDETVVTIVPTRFLSDAECIGETVFGSRAPSVISLGNSLLMSVGSFQFNDFKLVIVPVDPTETPIRRWRCEFMSPEPAKERVFQGEWYSLRHGRELVFRNDKKPAPCFLYFHFIMALARMRDLRRPGWQVVWARYHQERPFPTSFAYMRKSMVLALFKHFDTPVAEMPMLESWIAGNGFEVSSCLLTDAESAEAARRLREAAEIRLLDGERQMRLNIYETDSSSESDLEYSIPKSASSDSGSG